MSRRGRWLRRILFGVVVLALIYGAAYLALSIVATSRLDAELERARASGAVLLPSDAAPPPVPDEDNATVELERAFELLVEEPDELFEPGELDDPYYSLWDVIQDDPAALSAEHAALFASWVADNEDAIAIAEASLERPHCLFRSDWSGGWETMVSDHVPRVMGLARVLEARARLRIREEDVDGALADARTIFRLGRAVLSQSTAIDHLVGSGTEYVGLRVAQMALTAARPSEDAVRAWLPLLDEAQGDRPLEALYRFERALGNLAIELVRAGEYDETMDDVFGAERGFLPDAATFLFDGPAGHLDHARYLSVMAEVLELAKRPYLETRERWDALRGEVAARPWYDRLTWSCLSVHVMVRKKWEMHQARVDLARIAMRVELHDLREGRLPASLEELDVPGGVRDRFGSGPYVYRAEADGAGFVLYSVGENGVDDGGRETDDPQDEGDLVWRRPAR